MMFNPLCDCLFTDISHHYRTTAGMHTFFLYSCVFGNKTYSRQGWYTKALEFSRVKHERVQREVVVLPVHWRIQKLRRKHS